MNKRELIVRMAPSVGSLPGAEWDALDHHGNPFTSHAFLTALEDSGSVGGHSGWDPAPLVITDNDGRLAGALPAYL
ncbi:MAG: peptidogalycan biosysnthesis protein, partial [Novosphingobium sp.]